MLMSILAIFILGYLAITLEQFTKTNKGVVAILIGVLCWTVLALSSAAPPHGITQSLIIYLVYIAGIPFFWYVREMGIAPVAGYCAGAGARVFVLQSRVFG